MTKSCRVCEAVKSPDDFYRNRRVCKACLMAQRLRVIRADPAKHSARTREWQRNNPTKVLEMKLRREYGITLAEYDALNAAQGGVCRICERTCRTGQRLAVDHCHETGRVRGLLCRGCNTVLGLMKDDPSLLVKAANYLGQRTVEVAAS